MATSSSISRKRRASLPRGGLDSALHRFGDRRDHSSESEEHSESRDDETDHETGKQSARELLLRLVGHKKLSHLSDSLKEYELARWNHSVSVMDRRSGIAARWPQRIDRVVGRKDFLLVSHALVETEPRGALQTARHEKRVEMRSRVVEGSARSNVLLVQDDVRAVGDEARDLPRPVIDEKRSAIDLCE